MGFTAFTVDIPEAGIKETRSCGYLSGQVQHPKPRLPAWCWGPPRRCSWPDRMLRVRRGCPRQCAVPLLQALHVTFLAPSQHATYYLHVVHGDRAWRLEKRYSEFEDFHKQLQYTALPTHAAPPCPQPEPVRLQDQVLVHEPPRAPPKDDLPP